MVRLLAVEPFLRMDPAFDSLVPAGAQIEKLAAGFTFTEGPLWRPQGALWFSDVIGNVVRQWSPDGTVIEILRRELQVMMAQTGAGSISKIRRDSLVSRG